MVACRIMKQYVIDEIRSQDYEKIKAYLDQTFGEAEMGGIYWIPLDPKMLTHVQEAHKECQPFYFAIDLAPGRLACEFLIRTKSRLRCDCIGYATDRQRNWVMKTIDAIFEKLETKT